MRSAIALGTDNGGFVAEEVIPLTFELSPEGNYEAVVALPNNDQYTALAISPAEGIVRVADVVSGTFTAEEPTDPAFAVFVAQTAMWDISAQLLVTVDEADYIVYVTFAN